MPIEDPWRILELEPEATGEEIRAAYLRKIKQYPPERHPEEFERVRDAYEDLRDPRGRTRKLLFSGDPLPPLEHLLEGACRGAALCRSQAMAGGLEESMSPPDRETLLRRWRAGWMKRWPPKTPRGASPRRSSPRPPRRLRATCMRCRRRSPP